MELEKIKEIISNVKNIDINQLNENTNFIDDLKCDSIEVFQILMGVEEAFGIEIKNEDLLKIKTINDAIEIIKNAK